MQEEGISEIAIKDNNCVTILSTCLCAFTFLYRFIKSGSYTHCFPVFCCCDVKFKKEDVGSTNSGV